MSLNLSSIAIPNGITSIGANAFSFNNISGVTIPGSVTIIHQGAFVSNQITNLMLNEGLTTIEGGAFALNNLRSVTLPNSVVTLQIPTIYNGDANDPTVAISPFSMQGPAARDFVGNVTMTGYIYVTQATYDNPSAAAYIRNATDQSWLVAVYTKDGTNPHGFTDFIDMATITDAPGGRVTGNFTLGGYLINPAPLTIEYVNQQNTQLKQSITYTGQLADGTLLTDYSIKSIANFIPYPATTWRATNAELTNITNTLNAFQRLGRTVTVTPPAIAGYTAPATQTIRLSAAGQIVPLVYTAPPSGAAQSELANTGSGSSAITLAALVTIIVSLLLMAMGRKKTPTHVL